jgi:hypothetical protein
MLILRRAAADMVRFGAEPVDFATNVGCAFRIPAHRARCARAILRREAAEIIRLGWVALPGVAAPVPFNDSIPEMI